MFDRVYRVYVGFV